jgi:hypothetical protein
MGTARSGYIQRRIVKVGEDIQIQHDGSVRDTTGNIYQMTYGNNNMDPTQTVKVGGTQEPCDVSRIIDRLNLQKEMDDEIKKTLGEKVIEKPVESVKKLEGKPKRITLLKNLAKITGTKSMYKGVSDDDLIKQLENLILKK